VRKREKCGKTGAPSPNTWLNPPWAAAAQGWSAVCDPKSANQGGVPVSRAPQVPLESRGFAAGATNHIRDKAHLGGPAGAGPARSPGLAHPQESGQFRSENLLRQACQWGLRGQVPSHRVVGPLGFWGPAAKFKRTRPPVGGAAVAASRSDFAAAQPEGVGLQGHSIGWSQRLSRLDSGQRRGSLVGLGVSWAGDEKPRSGNPGGDVWWGEQQGRGAPTGGQIRYRPESQASPHRTEQLGPPLGQALTPELKS